MENPLRAQPAPKRRDGGHHYVAGDPARCLMRGHDEAPQERDPNLDGVIETITRNYRPADSVETATLRLTTTEVFELVRQHYPAATYTSVEVYVALKEFGYQSADVYGDLVQRWLLQRLA